MDLNLQKKVKKLNNCLFERDLNHLKTYKYKQNSSRDKYFISGLDEEFIQKYIKNQLEKKNLYKNKDSFSSKSSKLIETNQTTLKSYINQFSKRTSNNLNDSINKINENEKRNNSFNKFEINKPPISIKYSSQNLFYKKKIDNCKINISNLKYCKSVKNFNKNNITYNNSHREFNSNKRNNIGIIKQKSEKEIKIKKNNINHKRNKTAELKVFNNNKLNYEKYKQLLINKITILKYEISKYKEEKNKFEKELNSLKPSIKQEQYINILTMEIQNYKSLQEMYKKNCDELTKEIINIKEKIKNLKILIE